MGAGPPTTTLGAPVGLADELERRLERVVEGFFSRTFRSHVQPAEIGRRILRDMEGGKSVSVGAVYVPNRYTIRLAPADHGRFEGLIPALQKEFADLARRGARERRWHFPGPVEVGFAEDAGVAEGRFEVDAAHEAGEPEAPPEEPTPTLRLLGPDARVFVLESAGLTIGRLPSCEVLLADSNVSRTHARIERREDGWWIVDLGSTNGTLVNGALVKERRLAHADLVQVGGSELEYREGPSSDE